MPTSTPSPHRFLVPQPRSTAKPGPKPSSNLCHVVSTQTPERHRTKSEDTPAPNPQRLTATRRFVLTPKAASRGTTAQWEREAGLAAPKAKPRPTLQSHDSIDETSEGSPSTSQNSQLLLDTGPPPHLDETADDEDEELLFRPQHYEQHNKRRRLSPKPSTPAPPHRFLVPCQYPTTSPSISTTPGPVPSRSHFLLPAHPPSPAKPSAPLPETFSPSRKGNKFIPGGLASTLQSWIIETANAGYQTQTKDTVVWGREKEDGVKLRVRIEEVMFGKDGLRGRGTDEGVDCFPGGVVFVKGGTNIGTDCSLQSPAVEDCRRVRVLLAGNGGASRSKRVRLHARDIVGIRAPLWEVDVGNKKWMVGVDWAIL
ncbi:uncharacterized protein EI97DRAFT_258218 [Westerdykella ornata]|uniref:Uncharacterized protein n=1 Tax=Westerdykella ornata TaxID=318751 RepID=A0A6A6J5M6_WESOR|nr:uncharacterized protein EI97DRAFT_258218 [Westerdykella ornata]KAF2271735.1 hypothetical protein EI97DRAFT_258218 [Westerdykella ornata]